MTATVSWNDRVRRRLKLRDVDILLAVVQAGSMGKAADALNMSQPAVSSAIANLERTLGVSLLDRSRQGVQPTAYGRVLVNRGVAMFDELRLGVQDIAFLDDPTAGEIRIGGSESTVSAIFSPIVHQLTRQYPRMSFRVVVGDIRTLSRQLDARQIDIAVNRLTKAPPEEHSVEVLFEDSLVVAAAPNHPFTRRRKIELAELLDEPWTLQPPDINFGAFALDAFRVNGVTPPRIAVATTSKSLRNELLATGRYLTVTTRCSVLLSRGLPPLKILPIRFRNTQHKVAMFTLKNRSLGRATELFTESLRAITKPLAKEK